MLRLEYSGLVSLIVGMTEFIPLLGAYIGGGTGVVLLLFISAKKALTFLLSLIHIFLFYIELFFDRDFAKIQVSCQL